MAAVADRRKVDLTDITRCRVAVVVPYGVVVDGDLQNPHARVVVGHFLKPPQGAVARDNPVARQPGKIVDSWDKSGACPPPLPAL